MVKTLKKGNSGLLDEQVESEEDVKIKVLLPYLKERGYSQKECLFEQSIEIQEGRKKKSIFADIVVYSNAKKETPILLCEVKSPKEILNRSVREQAISYARLLPKIAPLVLITNGLQVQVFQTISKARLLELPSRKAIHDDLVNLVISESLQKSLRDEAKHDLFIIDDVQTFKNVLKSCHNEIRNNEGYDSIAAFDEMSRILFCKMFEEKHGGTNRFRVSVFDDTISRLGVNVVKQIFNETKADPRYSGLFDPGATINLKDRTIRRIVSLFENYDLSLTAFDVKGEAFEYFLGDTFTGGLGEYFTPRNVVEFIVDSINPKIGHKIIDPFCGTGGFLIYAFEVVKEKIELQEFSEEEKEKWLVELSSRCLFGTDWKERTSQACKMNMMVHGDGSAGIFKHHALEDVDGVIFEGLFDVCVTNPPFGSIENEPAILKQYELGAGRKTQTREILALERAIRLVKPGGFIGIIIIDGILNNKSKSYVREYIRKFAHVKAVISLCQETFEGYGARAKTSILLLQKNMEGEESEESKSFIAIARNTGYAHNGLEIPGNELPDILLKYKEFLKDENIECNVDNVAIVTLEDRLDPEFYLSRGRSIQPNNNSPIEKGEFSELIKNLEYNYSKMQEGLSKASKINNFKTMKIGDLIEEVQVKEKIDRDRTYNLLGVRWWGAGVFLREQKIGRDIKASALCKVSSGWIIYNRLFAYRGSFAIIGNEHDSCFVSTEFPTFRVKEGVDNPENVAAYIVGCMNSEGYLKVIDGQSTGSTKQSRNRFAQKEFLNLDIRIPNTSEEISRLTALIEQLRSIRMNIDGLKDSAINIQREIERSLTIHQ